MFSTWLDLTHPPDWVASASNPDCLKHPRVAQLSAAQLSGEHLTIKRELKFKTLDIIAMQTSGFLNSLGLTQRMKKGLHSPRVFISRSVDFLNWDERVTWKENYLMLCWQLLEMLAITHRLLLVCLWLTGSLQVLRKEGGKELADYWQDTLYHCYCCCYCYCYCWYHYYY